MTFNRIGTGIVAGCAAVVIPAMPGLAGRATRAPKHMAMAKATPDSGMAVKCQAMMADGEKWMTEMKAADEQLDDLVGQANAASSIEKADATAERGRSPAPRPVPAQYGRMAPRYGITCPGMTFTSNMTGA